MFKLGKVFKLGKAILITFFIINKAIAIEQQAILVKPEKIRYFEFYNKFTTVGKCKFQASRDYYARIAGIVDRVSVIQGAYVTQGTEMIAINSPLAESIKMQGEAGFKFAQDVYDKNLSLLEQKIISHEVLSKSKVALEEARKALLTSRNIYEDMIMKAPFNGYLGVIKANPGDEIKVGDYLFSFIAQGDKILFLDLPENLLGKIDENAIISVKDAHNNDVIGKIIASANYISKNGTVTVKAIFPQETNLIHGSLVSANLIYGQHKSLAIPEKAILKNDQGNFVYKITEGNIVKQVYIKVGIRTEKMIELVSDNISENDMVVVDGLTKIQNDSVVEIIKN